MATMNLDPAPLPTPHSARSVTLEKEFLDFFKPKSISMSLVRVGGSRDGSYLVPEDFDGIEACFSPGVATYKTFEDQLTLAYGIRSHMVDFSVDVEDLETPLIDGMQTFSKVWLKEGNSKDSVTLAEWIKQREPQSEGDFLLQMDIEGGEYEVVDSATPAVLERFRILVIELHGVRSQIISSGRNAPIFKLIDKLDPIFQVVHVHPNNCEKPKALPGGKVLIPEVFEVTLLRRDRLSIRRGTKRPVNPRVPHLLDINRNAVHLPPVFLGARWSSPALYLTSFPLRLRQHLNYFVGVSLPRLRKKTRQIPRSVLDFFYRAIFPR